MKRGQITYFIIVGIVILISIGILTTFLMDRNSGLDNESDRIDEMSLTKKKVSEYVETCIQETAKDGVFYNSIQGGFYEPQPPYANDTYMMIPFYGDNAYYEFPELVALEEELALFINRNIDDCLNNMDDFTERGIEIDYSTHETQVSINHESITIDFKINDYANQNIGLDKTQYKADIQSDYYKYYKIAEEYINDQVGIPNAVNISSLMRISEDYGLDIEFTEHLGTHNEVIFIFQDSAFERENFDEYKYVFAIRYLW